MLKIRLMRIGAKKRPFYRVVVVDERAKRNGAYIENVGTYNPLTEPKDIKLDQPRIDHWLKMGAVKSDGFLRILGEAPQRPPRKAKKEKKEAPAQVAAEPKTEGTETPPATEEAAATETPAEPEVPAAEPVIASEETEAKQSESEETPTEEQGEVIKDTEPAGPPSEESEQK